MTPAADALALPRVPPPAATRHRRRDIVACALFAGAITTMGLAAFRPHPSAPDSENRALAPWPAPAPVREFTAGFERAFADRFGARASLLRLHNRLLVRVFGVSPAPHVLIGRDGWLFFLGEEGTSFDRYYRGTPALGDAEIARIVFELARRARYLARSASSICVRRSKPPRCASAFITQPTRTGTYSVPRSRIAKSCAPSRTRSRHVRSRSHPSRCRRTFPASTSIVATSRA